MTDSTPSGRGVARERLAPSDLGLRATPEAQTALESALARMPDGTGVRIWVETGIHPKVRMMFDRPTGRDRAVHLGAVPVYVDSLSERFLVGAEIQHLASGGQEGFHVVGPNVPGAPIPEGPPPASEARAATEARIRAALKQIYDPEIPMNLVDLGLIYGFEWKSDEELTIRMTLTSVGCPSTEQICSEVERAAREASGLPQVHVDVVWEPPWTPERMSLFAKRQFGYV
jgi:metal-sulfur cluster biosynthetic enzyme/Fe-S cluster assembly iron-binding protein IscA